jgi:hypothetical protein
VSTQLVVLDGALQPLIVVGVMLRNVMSKSGAPPVNAMPVAETVVA